VEKLQGSVAMKPGFQPLVLLGSSCSAMEMQRKRRGICGNQITAGVESCLYLLFEFEFGGDHDDDGDNEEEDDDDKPNQKVFCSSGPSLWGVDKSGKRSQQGR